MLVDHVVVLAVQHLLCMLICSTAMVAVHLVFALPTVTAPTRLLTECELLTTSVCSTGGVCPWGPPPAHEPEQAEPAVHTKHVVDAVCQCLRVTPSLEQHAGISLRGLSNRVQVCTGGIRPVCHATAFWHQPACHFGSLFTVRPYTWGRWLDNTVLTGCQPMGWQLTKWLQHWCTT